jgi:hypothetical protein
VTMVCDGDLIRWKREEGASAAKCVWDGSQVLRETGASGARQAREGGGAH